MRGVARLGAAGALIAILGLGPVACQPHGASTRIASDDAGVELATWLAKPEGDGPFPAVVLLHGCTGTEMNTRSRTVWRGLNRHAALLNDNGYVTLIVDSFGPRGVIHSCRGRHASDQMADADSAFDHLASLPFVDTGRIGVVGLSMGGSTALNLAAEVYGRARTRYAAAVAYYPYCADSLYRFDIPVLILIGADDDWTPARFCRSIASRAPGNLDMTIYPDTHHAFDLPMAGPYVIEMPPGVYRTVAGNPAARRDAQARMLAFFAEHLGGGTHGKESAEPAAAATHPGRLGRDGSHP